MVCFSINLTAKNVPYQPSLMKTRIYLSYFEFVCSYFKKGFLVHYSAHLDRKEFWVVKVEGRSQVSAPEHFLIIT